MHRSTLIGTIGLALLAGCDVAPTTPSRSIQAPSEPEYLVTGSGWTLGSLPFAPTAINDAGAIVGSQNGEAVLWQNGTLTLLPHLSGVAGPYTAVGISQKGLILGSAGGHALVWRFTNAAPTDIAIKGIAGATNPVGINDNETVVGNVYDQSTGKYGYAWRWTPASGLTFMAETAHAYIVTGLNASGYASGDAYPQNPGAMVVPVDLFWQSPPPNSPIPVRFDPSGVATPVGNPEFGHAFAINDEGDEIGEGAWSCGCWTGAYDAHVTLFPASSPYADWINAPYAANSKLTNARRIVGNDPGPFTYFNAVLTWLPYPTTLPAPPQVTGVNNCGTIIIGQQGTAGFIWRRGGALAACDLPATNIS